MVVNALIKIFQEELMLQLKIFYSRDEDEIFIKVKASEYNLGVQADLMDYKIQVHVPRPGEQDTGHHDPSDVFEKKDFSEVSPYGEYQNTIKRGDQASDLIEVYKAYTKVGKKAKNPKEAHSMFKYIDKVRIVFSMINSVVDLGVLVESQLIKQGFCLHDEKKLNLLRDNWAGIKNFYKPQNFKDLRRYFGEKIAMYFAWLQFYVFWLIIPASLGVATYITLDKSEDITVWSRGNMLVLSLSLVLSFGSTLLDQLWVRQQHGFAWSWGTTDMIEVEQQRPGFKGIYEIDRVTGLKRKVQTTRYLTKAKRYLATSISLMFVVCVLAMIIGIFILKHSKVEYKSYISMLNAVQIKFMNTVYRSVARKLTEWENFEYDSEFNDSLTLKLYIFQFINSYSSLIYIAFFKECEGFCSGDNKNGQSCNECMGELEYQLISILIINTGMNLFEIGMPYLKTKYSEYKERKNIERENLVRGVSMRTELTATEQQSKYAEYETPLDDYMEIVINFGYVVMFSIAFPLFPLFSLLLGILEVRVDAFKLAFLCRRPYPGPANSIGKWEQIVRAVSVVGSLISTGILVFTADIFQLNDGKSCNILEVNSSTLIEHSAVRSGCTANHWIYFIIIEHLLILFKVFLMEIVPHVSYKVRRGLIWSRRIAAEKIYGKAIDVEEQKVLRNLYFIKQEGVKNILLDPKNIDKED
jgi:Calcium-activated chloride channel